MKKFVTVGVGVLVLLAAIIATATSLFTLSALPEPGRTETFLATRAKHFLVRRSSREGILPTPAAQEASAKEGERLFGRNAARATEIAGIIPRMPAGGCTRVPPT